MKKQNYKDVKLNSRFLLYFYYDIITFVLGSVISNNVLRKQQKLKFTYRFL